ncbi:MAG TPA: GGDEF domain-containing protein [Burkholderiaceae bacterium]|nr:GGDEF domain-containing protein [Burkholderiaceae bacterium]
MHTTRPGAVRQLWIALFAAALMAVGVVLALRAMSFDSEMHHRYESALTLSQAAIEAQQASADLRSWQARNARELLRDGDAALPPSELAALVQASVELRSRLARLADLDMPPERKARIAELQAKLSGFEQLGQGTTSRSGTGSAGSQISRSALVSSSVEFDAFEHSMTELVVGTNARAAAIARQAVGLNETARTGLIAFSGITLVLAVLLIGLTLRTLRSNNVLLDQLSHLAQEDALTGIANRRTLDEALPVEFARALRSGQPLTLVMLDFDHFKRYNDRRGHAAGDALLRGAAQAWSKQMRPTDLLARYGGEEFTLVLPACTADQAAQLVDRLRPLMPDRQTFSAGIATWEGHETATELLQRADRALLLAKKGGRNRTMIAGRELQATLPLEVAATS